MIRLVHKYCGGSAKEDWGDPYRFEGDDADAFGETVPRYVCDKCGKEILGDAEITIEGTSLT